MTESEWKILRTVKQAALERLCGRILDECQVAIQASGTNHERYLRLFQVVEQGDKDIAWAFNGLRRSTADVSLGVMARLGLVTDEELGRFSEQTRTLVAFMAGTAR
jgi:hypothetical protein